MNRNTVGTFFAANWPLIVAVPAVLILLATGWLRREASQQQKEEQEEGEKPLFPFPW